MIIRSPPDRLDLRSNGGLFRQLGSQRLVMLGIIADDLTGAFDAAAPFAGRGLSVAVSVGVEALSTAVDLRCDVIAVTTQSREIEADQAKIRVGKALSMLPQGTRVFKKVDSRLKGHIKAELSALATGPLFVAPAIPEFGRIVVSRFVQGFGVNEPISIAQALGALADTAEIPDTTTMAEMQNALALAPANSLLVGAKGLADALAIQMTGIAEPRAPKAQAERVLMIVGSHDPITLAQVALLSSETIDWRQAPNGHMDDLRPIRGTTLVQAVPGTAAVSGAVVAQALAESAAPLIPTADAIFLTGGATAEAVVARLGWDVLRLDGDILPGVPLAWRDGRAVIVKSGGFGAPDTLVRLRALLQTF
jgi:D-threonate/D-erythronate kinase